MHVSKLPEISTAPVVEQCIVQKGAVAAAVGVSVGQKLPSSEGDRHQKPATGVDWSGSASSESTRAREGASAQIQAQAGGKPRHKRVTWRNADCLLGISISG
ncbi:unnamed protein product, partial [Sphacelaria rigidula]